MTQSSGGADFTPISEETAKALIASTTRVADSSYAYATAMTEYQERAVLARKRFRITMISISLIGLLMMGGIFGFLISAAQSRGQIADCIKPTGKCFRDNQDRTKAVLSQFEKVIILAATCAPDYVQLPFEARRVAIEKCITDNLVK